MRSRGCCSSFEDFGATHYPLRSKAAPLNPSRTPLKNLLSPYSINVNSPWSPFEIHEKSLVKSVWDAYAIPTLIPAIPEKCLWNHPSRCCPPLRTVLCTIAKYKIRCEIFVEIVCFSNLGRAAKILKMQKFQMQRFGTCKIMHNLNLISTCSRFPSATTTKKEQHHHQ